MEREMGFEPFGGHFNPAMLTPELLPAAAQRFIQLDHADEF